MCKSDGRFAPDKQKKGKNLGFVQANFRVRYIKSKMYSYIAKSVLNDNLGFRTEPCYIQNHVITKCFIKRLMCIKMMNYHIFRMFDMELKSILILY